MLLPFLYAIYQLVSFISTSQNLPADFRPLSLPPSRLFLSLSLSISHSLSLYLHRLFRTFFVLRLILAQISSFFVFVFAVFPLSLCSILVRGLPPVTKLKLRLYAFNALILHFVKDQAMTSVPVRCSHTSTIRIGKESSKIMRRAATNICLCSGPMLIASKGRPRKNGHKFAHICGTFDLSAVLKNTSVRSFVTT